MGAGITVDTITGLPTNPDFDITAYLQFRQERLLNNSLAIWTEDHLDHNRLPGNISIFDVLIYTEYILNQWLTYVGYNGDNIVYSPAFPDIIYTSQTVTAQTADSPHPKLPPIIAYRIARREPASTVGNQKYPFQGPSRHWKYRRAGVFRAEDGTTREVRSKFWENEIEFVCIHRSGGEAEALCISFEDFIDRNEPRFLAAGISKMTLMGRKPEPIFKLEEGGIHYRATRVWFKTQEFQISRNIPTIRGVNVEVDSL